MTKLVLALSATLALSAFGCKKEEKPAEPAKPTTPVVEAPKPAEPGAVQAPKPAEPGAVEAPKPAEPGAVEAPKPAEPGVAPAAPAVAAGEMPAECKEYAEKMTKCFDSPTYPAANKEQAQNAFSTLKRGWDNINNLKEEQRAAALKAAGETCKQSIEGMKAVGTKACPGTF